MSKSTQNLSSFLVGNPASGNHIGQQAEQATQQYYRERGCEIIEQNFFNHKGKRFGEIDFIALKGRSIYFVEVRARSSKKFGSSLESFTKAKRAKVCKTAQYFLLCNRQYRQLQPKIHLAAVAINPVDKTILSIKIHTEVID